MIICPWKDIMRYAPVIPGLEEAVNAVNGLTSLEPASYPLSGEGKVNVQQGTTKPGIGENLEAHRKFLDIQLVLKGQDMMGWAPLDTLTPADAFNADSDVGFYSGPCDFYRIPEGYCCVLFPEDAHMPGRHLDVPNDYVKVVVKLKV